MERAMERVCPQGAVHENRARWRSAERPLHAGSRSLPCRRFKNRAPCWVFRRDNLHTGARSLPCIDCLEWGQRCLFVMDTHSSSAPLSW